MNIFEVQTFTGTLFKELIRVIEAAAYNYVNFRFTQQGLYTMTIGSPDREDPTSNIITEFKIDALDFSMYFCTRHNVIIGMDLSSLKTVVEPLTHRDIFEIVASEDDLDRHICRVNIMRPGEAHVVHVLGNHEITGTDVYKIEDLDYDAKITMPASVFARICNEVGDNFPNVVISVTVEGVTISAPNDNEANIVYSSVEKPDDGVVIEINRPVSMTYCAASLSPTARTSPLLDKVVMSVIPEHLLKIEYKILAGSFIRFWVAPIETA